MLDFLQISTFLYIFCIGLISLAVGSFLNVVISRLPAALQQSIPSQYLLLCIPRSHCPRCKSSLSIPDLIPVWSYYRLLGRCRYCKNPISFRYPVVEVITCVLSIVVATRFGFTLATLAALLFTWALIALAFIDIEYLLLPNSIILPFIGFGLLCNFFGTFQPFYSAVLGALCGYLLLWSVYWIYKVLTEKEGLGHGDFKLLAMLGAWLGLGMLPLIVLLSSFIGAVWGIGLMLTNKASRNTPLPFGAFLAFGGFVALIWGETLTHLYLRMIGL